MSRILKSTRAATPCSDDIAISTQQCHRLIKTHGKELVIDTNNGAYTRHRDGVVISIGEEGAKTAVCSYIHCEANIVVASTGLVSVRVGFNDFEHQWKTVLVPRADFNYPNRLLEQLLNAGFAILDTNLAKEFLTKLYQYDSPIPTIINVSIPGWHPIDDENQAFVTNGTIYAPEGVTCNMALNGNVDTGHSSKGELSSWQEHVALPCLKNSRLAFMVSASISAPMLNLIGHPSIGIHIYGPSRAGKTTGLKLACSVYGNTKFLSSWNATANALQEMAGSRNDGALLLDEISQCDEKQVNAAVYDLMNGKTKSRLSSTSKLNTGTSIKLVVISTGELSLQEHLQQAGLNVKTGQLVRLISIPVNPKTGMFSNLHEHATHGEFAASLLRNADHYYGTAGPEFIRHLVENQQQLRQILPAQVREIENSILESIKSDDLTELQRSIARSFAVIACAGELAIGYEVFPWSKGDAISAAKACYKAWNRHEKEAAGARDPAFISLKQFFRDEHSSFMPLEQYTKASKTVHTHTVDGSLAFLVSLEHFERVLCCEFGKAAGIAALKKRRLLVLDSRGGPTRQHMIPNSTKPVRLSFYVIRSSILTAE